MQKLRDISRICLHICRNELNHNYLKIIHF